MKTPIRDACMLINRKSIEGRLLTVIDSNFRPVCLKDLWKCEEFHGCPILFNIILIFLRYVYLFVPIILDLFIRQLSI